MPRVIWSPRALLDLQRLHRFLAAKNPDAAQRALRAVRAGVKLLALQPGVGRPAPDMTQPWREWLVDFGDSGYVVRYRLDVQVVLIAAVRHQKEAGY